jgi:hypothetical protein
LLNLVTVDDIVYDVAVRNFAFDPYLYGTGPFDKDQAPDDLAAWQRAHKHYNPNYYPLFYKEIWPILQRPESMKWVTSLLASVSDPHNTGPNGNFDETRLSLPPYHGQDPQEARLCQEMRNYLYKSLRRPGDENRAYNHEDPESRLYGAPYMPLLAGDNPLSNTLPSKFLRLTDTQYFLLGQWAAGKFVNERREDMDEALVGLEPPGVALDRAVLTNALGGAFCPGGEVSWIIRNPAIYSAPYRINASKTYLPGMDATSETQGIPGVELYERPALNQLNLVSDGIEPGDLTKYSPLPWQADFNECSYQPIDVTYQGWAVTYPDDPSETQIQNVLWWPAHRPMQVFVERPMLTPGQPTYDQIDWSRGIAQTAAGDLRMVTAWKDLGFIVNVPKDDGTPFYLEVQRNDAALGGKPTQQGCWPTDGDGADDGVEDDDSTAE